MYRSISIPCYTPPLVVRGHWYQVVVVVVVVVVVAQVVALVAQVVVAVEVVVEVVVVVAPASVMFTHRTL
jgi:hypothetical protein